MIRGANFGHLATLMRDGAPHIDPVWIDLEGDTILVCSGTGSLKSKNTKRDPRVGLSVIARTILTRKPNSVAELSSSALIGTLP